MTTSAPPATVAVEPVVRWPDVVEIGHRHLVVVDVRLADADDQPWPYEHEEFVLTSVLEGPPFAQITAVDPPSLTLHRFGGTYRPVRYVVSIPARPEADDEDDLDDDQWDDLQDELSGSSLRMSLVNPAGVVIRSVELPFTIVDGAGPSDGIWLPDVGEAPYSEVEDMPAQSDTASSAGIDQGQVWPGRAYPLGATYDGGGTNFALFSEIAVRVELCLFDADGIETRIDLPAVDSFVWHCYLPGAEPGQRYGYRVHGPNDPERGFRCNPAKLLLDPYARTIEGELDWDESLRGDSDLDSAPHVPKSVVVNPFFDWGADRAPRTPYATTLLYEAHVKGMTQLHPDVPDELRGTYAGLAHPVVIDHLTSLGVTAVEVMPVQSWIDERSVVERGLTNYWGYNTIGFFAPDARLASRPGAELDEFKAMVKALHAAGLEVILDVAYTHTAEGDQNGPTLCFRGIDNPAYYKLTDGDASRYLDYTGTGNALNMSHASTLQMIMDSLRYWITEMHVDGFRFDLASALARVLYDVDRLSSFFQLIQQDPVINQVKLIAEPWDVGPGGYQVGNFPPQWVELNPKFRDDVRDFWRAEGSPAGLATRIAGSSDLFDRSGRGPLASVNHVVSHDGFTLADLVSYNTKHNEANGDGNRDGMDDNRSWNCGVEGPTDDPDIGELRRRQQRNLLATVFVSQGVPMLSHGDELGRTQHGNNNAWCQDNETAWLDWSRVDTDLLQFARELARFRAEHPVLRRSRHLDGREGPDGLADVSWFTARGTPMTESDWNNPTAAAQFAVHLNGDAIAERDSRGGRIAGESLFIAFNAADQPGRFTLPDARYAASWQVAFDTAVARASAPPPPVPAAGTIVLAAHALVVLRADRSVMPRPSGPETFEE